MNTEIQLDYTGLTVSAGVSTEGLPDVRENLDHRTRNAGLIWVVAIGWGGSSSFLQRCREG